MLRQVTVVWWLGLLAGIVQLGDAWFRLRQHHAGKALGPLAIAVLQFALLVPLWQSSLRLI